MKVSDLMEAMNRAGAPMEAILIAVRAIEERNAAIDAKRAVERDRKRRQRANDRGNDGTVAGQSRDTDGTVTDTPSLPRPLSPQTPLTPTPTHPEINTRTRKGTRLPAHWGPKALPEAITAEVGGWPAGAIERELSRFRDWAAAATGKNAVKSDWDAAWRNWLRSRIDEGTYGNGKPIRKTGSADHRSNRARAIDQALQFLGP